MHVLVFAVVGPLIGALFFMHIFFPFERCRTSALCLKTIYEKTIIHFNLLDYLTMIAFLFSMMLAPSISAGILYIATAHCRSPNACIFWYRRITIGAFFGLLSGYLLGNITFLIMDGALLPNLTYTLAFLLHGAFAGAVCAALMGERFYRWCFYRKVQA